MCCRACRKYEFWYLILCTIVYSLCYFYRSSIVAITDALQRDFSTDASGIGYLASFIFFSYFCMQLVIGLLLEIYSFQLLLFLGAFGLGVTSILFGIAQNLIFATAVRFVAGIALAPLFLTGITIGAQRYGNKYVGLVTGILLFSSQSLLSLLVTFQAWLYDKHGRWREVYYGMGLIAFLVSIIVAIMAIVEVEGGPDKIHYVEVGNDNNNKYGAIDSNQNSSNGLKRPATAPLLDKYNKSKSKYSSKSLSKSLVFRPDRMEHSDSKVGKMIHSLKKSLCYSVNWILGLQQFSLRSITYALNGLWIVAYLRAKFLYSPELAASISGTFFISSSFGSLFSGKMMQKYKQRKLFLIIGVILSQFCVIFIYGLPEKSKLPIHEDWVLIIIITCNAISGFGSGFLPVGFTMARELNDKYKCSDTATGMVNMIGNAAGFVSQMVVSSLIDVSWKQGPMKILPDGEREYRVADYQFAFMWIPVTGIIGLVMSIIVTEPKGPGFAGVSYSSFNPSDKEKRRKTSSSVHELELSRKTSEGQ